MNEIKTAGIVGLGALGTMYAHMLTKALGRERVFVFADGARVERYRREGVYYNGEPQDFRYAIPSKPVDLLLFAVKFGALEDAITLCRPAVGPETTLVSVLNGIVSEEILGAAYDPAQVVWCVAQKMSAVKEGNRAVAGPTGELALGVLQGMDRGHLDRLTAFFDRISFAYSLPEDIRKHMWSKLMCNTGGNQSCLVYACGYGGLQVPGPARDTMLGAMREVMAVANAEGVPLTEQDIQGWVDITAGFPPEGETSMRQDGKAHRKSEVELFAGTVRRLAAKHGIPVPVNDWLYEKIHEIEAGYEKNGGE